MNSVRVFIYVQHLLGIGHLMRTNEIVREMRSLGIHVTYAIGGFVHPFAEFRDAEIIQLPPVRTADPSFKNLVDKNGKSVGRDWRRDRKRILLEAFEAADPDVLVIETFPFGRWPFRFELLPLLEIARRRAHIVCSVRDVLVAKRERRRLDAIIQLIREYFELVLVHGDPELVSFERTFPRIRELGGKIQYTGYIASFPQRPFKTEIHLARGPDEIVVSAGGGATGGHLMCTAHAACKQANGIEARWRFLVGPNMPKEDSNLLTSGPNFTVEQVREDFQDLLSKSIASISQAGYNTVMDAIAARCRMLLVPFEGNGQSEQLLRARLLSDRGVAHLIRARELTPSKLVNAVEKIAAGPCPNFSELNLQGAATTANLIAQLATMPRRG